MPSSKQSVMRGEEKMKGTSDNGVYISNSGGTSYDWHKSDFNKAFKRYTKVSEAIRNIHRSWWRRNGNTFLPVWHKNLNAAIVNSFLKRVSYNMLGREPWKNCSCRSAKLFINLAPLKIYWSSKDRFYNWLRAVMCVKKRIDRCKVTMHAC